MVRKKGSIFYLPDRLNWLSRLSSIDSNQGRTPEK